MGIPENILNTLFADVPRKKKKNVVLLMADIAEDKISQFEMIMGITLSLTNVKTLNWFWNAVQLLCIFMLFILSMRQSLHSSDAEFLYA